MADVALDPRLVLVTVIAGATLSAVEKIVALLKENGNDDVDLAAIVAEVDVRLARRPA